MNRKRPRWKSAPRSSSKPQAHLHKPAAWKSPLGEDPPNKPHHRPPSALRGQRGEKNGPPAPRREPLPLLQQPEFVAVRSTRRDGRHCVQQSDRNGRVPETRFAACACEAAGCDCLWQWTGRFGCDVERRCERRVGVQGRTKFPSKYR